MYNHCPRIPRLVVQITHQYVKRVKINGFQNYSLILMVRVFYGKGVGEIKSAWNRIHRYYWIHTKTVLDKNLKCT